ncbi:stage V sporulation protein AD [Proteinivorax hydrogeniformans]|uniref:Stage V sporulation protein AD n=1 Tax=Proteinivorax hydrogeniformans TaxID=1826727 RepID=A0AAU8HQH1_9FIRM
MAKKVGNWTYQLDTEINIVSSATVSGPKEKKGPYGQYFDITYSEMTCGEKSFEKAEKKLMTEAVEKALKNNKLKTDDVDIFLAGDLLNQIITSSFTASDLSIPFLGLYGACSTFVEGLIVGSTLLEAGCGKRVVTATSSHYAAAERQFRFPTEYGGKPPGYSQHTVTGAGSTVLEANKSGPKITHFTVGKVLDKGIKDPYDMGSAMAPAAADTLKNILDDTQKSPEDFDLILTGDLGQVGGKILKDLLNEAGYFLGTNYVDCGVEIYGEDPSVNAGGSGCACSALMTLGYYLKQKQYKKIIVVATGALLSPTTFQQGEAVPSTAHGVIIENKEES